VRRLSEVERDALPILARGAAMRFFATRLADWAATPPGALVRPKDPREYADKLAFHRKAESAADYGA
jgi:homoserine kinase type II